MSGLEGLWGLGVWGFRGLGFTVWGLGFGVGVWGLGFILRAQQDSPLHNVNS